MPAAHAAEEPGRSRLPRCILVTFEERLAFVVEKKTFFTLFFFLVEELGHVMVFVVTEFRPNSIHRE